MSKHTISQKELKWLSTCVINSQIFATCGKRQYYAIILDAMGHVAGTGYNGGPKGTVHCVDGGCPRLAEGSAAGSNYDNCIAIHAEQNAFLHSDYSTIQGGTLFVNGPPCFTCAKLAANSGVKRIVCIRDDAYAMWPEVQKNLEDWGVEVVVVDPNLVSHAVGVYVAHIQ